MVAAGRVTGHVTIPESHPAPLLSRSYVFCPECGRVYKNKNSLSVHMSMYHNSQRRAAQREPALQAQAAAQAQAQAAAGVWQADASSLAAARQPWPAE